MTSATILDGRALADDIYRSLVAEWPETERGETTLGIIVVGENPVIESFVRIKTKSAERLGIRMDRVNLPEATTTEEVEQAVHQLAARADAVIVQLPLPKHVDTEAVLAAIPPEKDVDAINPQIPESERPVHAPVALAVLEFLDRAGVGVKGKRTVVIGAGRLVGKPTAILLRERGAELSMFTLDEGSIADLKDADIIVCGAGSPGFVKPEHIKEGVVIIDAGASEQGGVIRGDADPACAEKASAITPVPGGVGPVAVAMIFRNLKKLAKK